MSPGVLACLSYTMASIQAIDHENAHLLLLFQDEVREATSSGGVLELRTAGTAFLYTYAMRDAGMFFLKYGLIEVPRKLP